MELRRIVKEYVNTPETPVQHGLISKMLQTLHGQANTLTTTEYAYSITRNVRADAMALRTVSTLIGFDDCPYDPDQPGKPEKWVRKVITQEHALLSGIKLLSNDG